MSCIPAQWQCELGNVLEFYNSEVDRWRKQASNAVTVDDFVSYDSKRIKWSEGLKLDLKRSHYAELSETKFRRSLYRPFCKEWLVFDRTLNERVYQLPQIFPDPISETENWLIVVSDHGFRSPFSTLVTNIIPNLHLLATTDAFQCFPYYTYAADGSNRHENITDWALGQFQAKYGSGVTKWDIFHYVYAMLHHPRYRERYVENLKHDLPHIPLLSNTAAFQTCVRIGNQLMELHLHYEQAKEHPLQWIENKDVSFSWRVEKMHLTPDRNALLVNQSLTLEGIPQECFAYRLGNRSALEWVIDQYQVSEHKRSGIVIDPNNPDDEEYIVHLVGRVITVSVETVRLVNELERAVTQADWMSETSML